MISRTICVLLAMSAAVAGAPLSDRMFFIREMFPNNLVNVLCIANDPSSIGTVEEGLSLPPVDPASGNTLREIPVDVLARVSDVDSVEQDEELVKREPLNPTNQCIIM
jgi:hypothetical protein